MGKAKTIVGNSEFLNAGELTIMERSLKYILTDYVNGLHHNGKPTSKYIHFLYMTSFQIYLIMCTYT